MIRVIGWETTQEEIDRNVEQARQNESRQKKKSTINRFESEHTAMRADLNREIERKIERAWLDEVCRPII